METPIYCFKIILANPHPLSDRKALRIAWRNVFKQFIWYADSDLMSNEVNAHLFIDMEGYESQIMPYAWSVLIPLMS